MPTLLIKLQLSGEKYNELWIELQTAKTAFFAHVAMVKEKTALTDIVSLNLEDKSRCLRAEFESYRRESKKAFGE